MKSAISLVTALVFAGHSAAYPSILAHLEQQAGGNAPLKRDSLVFDAAAQYISTSGDHAFVAPGPNDQRGPCPGLNAAANHGYLPHDGVATISEFVAGTNKVFGMGLDLGAFLSVYGAVADGDGTKWSIGGPTSEVGALAGLLSLGQPTGISGSHNKYESDVSPTRGDLYQYGNDYLLQVSQFQQLYDMGAANDNYDLSLLTQFRANRFQQSKSDNPYFFNGAFSGVIVQPAAYTFIYRFMANKSAEYPEGRLDGDVLKSFFSITGDSGNFKYTPGYERIPKNWYTRNALDPYTIPFFSLDLNAAAAQYPEFLSIGGNTGKVNSFTGVDITNLTGGVYNLQTLLQGNNLACFGLQTAVQALPDFISGLLTNSALSNLLDSALGNATAGLDCPQLTEIDEDQFAQYPGYAKLNTNTGSY
ncbi:hypothetical protein AAFC00_003820 [Neodothiora populina]|uniref:Heme haloperoxidase family profile domain-containing protein n=1 Tax=Neodothiora populina TaxID=2781224 RepID=A0ABR3PFG6_9PEZI